MRNSVTWLKVAVGLLVPIVASLVFLSWKGTIELREKTTGPKVSIDRTGPSPKLPASDPIEGEGMIVPSGISWIQEKPPSPSEMPFAEAVPGNPLVVKIPGLENLGQISVEQYSRDGRPTGRPLPRGTPVQIPHPDQPGGKIYFKVP